MTVRTHHPLLGVDYLTPTVARVTFELVAPWPIKRGASHSESTGGQERGEGRTYPRPDVNGWWAYGRAGSSGNIVATNAGNAPVRPQFLIAGPCVNPQIIAATQNRRLDFDITLAEGDVLGVDADTHAVVLNDVANRRYLLTADSAWFDLLPGENLLQYRPDDNSGTLTVYWSDGWW